MKTIRKLVCNLLIVFLTACNFASSTSATPPNGDSTSSPSQSILGETPVLTGNADIIFTNGVILTMDEANPSAQAIAIRGNKIVALGTNEEALSVQGKNPVIVDLAGLTLMPGIVDAHSHIFLYSGNANTDAVGAQDIMLGFGVTSIGELSGDENHLLYLRDLGNAGQIRIRVSIYPNVYNEGCEGTIHDQDWYKAYPPGAEFAPRVRMGGIKIYTDGSFCVAPAVSFNYGSDGGNGTLFFESPEALASVLRKYTDQGYQVAIHAIGDRAIEQTQQAIALFPPEARDFNHFRTEHNAVIRPDLMAGYTNLGIVGVLFGGYPTCFFTNSQGNFRYRTPEEYYIWEWPWKELLDANPQGHFAYHSDAFGNHSPNPFDQLYGMVTRKQVAEDGSICEPVPAFAKSAITAEQALEIMTIGGAYALNQEQWIGSLEVGKLADLIILSDNPLGVNANKLREITALMTMIDGKVEYCAAGREALCPSASPSDPEPAATSPAFFSPVTTSAELPDSPASNAIDGIAETIWNSGADPEQWIRIDLGQPTTVRAIRLVISQYPEGETTHQIWGGADAGSLTLLHEFKGLTSEPGVLEFRPSAPLTNIRYIQIITTQSPSWVAWREIEVIEE